MQQLSQSPINGPSLPWPSSAYIFDLLAKAIGKGRIPYNSGIAGNSSDSAITFPAPPSLEELGLGNGPV